MRYYAESQIRLLHRYCLHTETGCTCALPDSLPPCHLFDLSFIHFNVLLKSSSIPFPIYSLFSNTIKEFVSGGTSYYL